VHRRPAFFVLSHRGALLAALQTLTSIRLRAVAHSTYVGPRGCHALPISRLANCDEVAPHPRLLPPGLVARLMSGQDDA